VGQKPSDAEVGGPGELKEVHALLENSDVAASRQSAALFFN
jgi:hypothetical protein